MKKIVSKIFKGLNLDSDKKYQPESTYSFALNAVHNSLDGDNTNLINESGNEEYANIPTGYIIIGTIYISNEETVLFLVKEDESLSEIGVLKNGTYSTIMNYDLGFMIKNQIDCTYRLRRGCERVLYFVDGINRPRIFNLDKMQDYKQEFSLLPLDYEDVDKYWDIDKFNLFRRYSTIPSISNISFLNSGSLKAGSYTINIQYLDEDKNPTEFISGTRPINIYHDNTSKGFSEIRGSTSAVNSYQDFGSTGKSISLRLDFLDTSFPYYRLGITETYDGTGEISRVVYTDSISTRVGAFTYTGSNFAALGTIEEIQQYSFNIETADHIEQLENRLILGNVKNFQANLCKLQKYASRIKANVTFEKIRLNEINSKNNHKRGQVLNEKVGYVPGEIYSFGIEYIFDDLSMSPVYHIPGKNPSAPSLMSDDNLCINTYYEDVRDSGIWGVDCQGDVLKNTPIRHHRFPTRSEVNKPFIENNGTASEVSNYVLYVDISGVIDTGYIDTVINYTVHYTIFGVANQVTKSLNVGNYNQNVDSNGVPLGLQNIYIDSSLSSSIQLVSVDEADSNNDPIPGGSDLVYGSSVVEDTSVVDDTIYESDIFGIAFSDIELPSEKEIGKKIIGYNIVRNERTESEKTILDSAILTPLLLDDDGVYASHGHLIPDSDNVMYDTFAIIHPKFKFEEVKYSQVDQIISDGTFDTTFTNYVNTVIEDVQPGTSYDSSIHKKRDKDSDGYSLHNVARVSQLNYTYGTSQVLVDRDVDDFEIFYLDTLYSNKIIDSNNNDFEIFNLSSDNKIGILSLKKRLFSNSYLKNKLPRIVLKRKTANPYSNFRILAYKKENLTPFYFNTQFESCTIFNGDSFISPMTYTSSMFYDVALDNRRTKNGVLNYIIGGLSIVAGAILTVTGVGTAVGISLLGFGVSQVATGLKTSQMAKVYQDLYEKGLNKTIADDYTPTPFSTRDDDEIQWFYDILAGLWFESDINLNWRVGSTIGLTDFLDAPTTFNERKFENYLLDKVTTMDNKADGGRSYQGYAKAEIYNLNKDYSRRAVEKISYHLPEEYDCGSKCSEEFPHRVYYSEQSFQEELSDNYRTFLVNNYRDIEGNSGAITNLFKIQTNLYIHTEEGLWHLPQNIQERVTGDLISYIGTGEFFAIPPRKIVDDERGNSAGCQHKWGTLKTPHGVLFITESQGTIYLFDGNSLSPISNKGLFNWFKNNAPIEFDGNFQKVNSFDFEYRDNPSNNLGTGYVSIYDGRNERLLITKKDYSDEYLDSLEDYNICEKDGEIVVFENYSSIIEEQEQAGWVYKGIEDCMLQFEKESVETKVIDVVEKLPNDADVVVQMDMTGSFTDITRQQVRDAVIAWENSYRSSNTSWDGNLYFCEIPVVEESIESNTDSERWLHILYYVETGYHIYKYEDNGSITTVNAGDISDNIIAVSFVNEASPSTGSIVVYHSSTFGATIPSPTQKYFSDYADFVARYTTKIANGNTFRGLLYPIVYSPVADWEPGSDPGFDIYEETYAMLQHSFAAMNGIPYTPAEITTISAEPNPFMTEWDTLITSLPTPNPYNDDGLKNYGWELEWTRGYAGGTDIITSSQFQEDMEDFLQGSVEILQESKDFPITIYKEIEGVPIVLDKIKKDWTLSYSLINEAWTSFHSYLPNLYFNRGQNVFSWLNGSNKIWKHNSEELFQNFYGNKEKFILEYVSIDNSLETKIFDCLQFSTEAYRFNTDLESFEKIDNVTFNKGILYNSTQSTGEVLLVPKDKDVDYLQDQIKTSSTALKLDNNQNEWDLNEIRDYAISPNSGLFVKNKSSLQVDYFIDKIVNSDNINYDKPWFEVEPLKGKYLAVRFIFDTFDDVKLIFSSSVETENISVQ